MSAAYLTTQFFTELPSHFRGTVVTDVGNDPDDLAAIALWNQHRPETLTQITTVLFDPRRKAEIASQVLTALGNRDTRIIAGSGCIPKSAEDFLEKFPFWPLPFGIPGLTNAVSKLQGTAFDLERFPLAHTQVRHEDAPSAIKEEAGDDAVVLALAPTTDLTEAIRRGAKYNRIVIQGGFFGKFDGDVITVERLGYNTAVDPYSAEELFTQSHTPVLIINSQQVKDWEFAWRQSEVIAILQSASKTELSEAMAQDLYNYWSNKKPQPFGDLVMGDVLTAYVGVLHPELIKTTLPVKFTFGEKYFENTETGLREPIHMLLKQASTLFTVRKEDGSNVHIVTELTLPPDVVRQRVVRDLVSEFYSDDFESFEAAVAEADRQNYTAEQIKDMFKMRSSL